MGLLRLIFVSKSPSVSHLSHWATDVVFTSRIGDRARKEIAAANLLDVHVDAIKCIFDKNSTLLTCVYLISLGKVSSLRSSFNIKEPFSDDAIVYKFGHTKDLARRINEHKKTYSEISNVKMNLKLYSYIDKQNTKEAEKDLKQILKLMKVRIHNKKYIELVALDNSELKKTKMHYTEIGNKYMGKLEDMKKEVEETTETMKKLREEHDHKMELKEAEIAKLQSEAKLKDALIESLMRENKLLSRENN